MIEEIIGEYKEIKIDERRRITIPSELRKCFNNKIYLRFLGKDKKKIFYEIMSEAIFKKEKLEYSSRKPYDKDRINFFSSIENTKIDNKGRIILPKEINKKDISRVVLKGNYDRIILELYLKKT